MDTGPLSILGFGFVLGLKHALDSDHLVAVSTIVSERRGFWSSSLVGALWGLGHTASLLAVGLAVVAFGLHIPDRAAQAMELGVAVMLVALGASVLWKLARGGRFHVHVHEHDDHVHIHPHLHTPAVAHEQPAAHDHAGKKPFLVGMVHGLAGSASLMLVVLATISSRPLALLYIAVFGVGSVGGMLTMSTVIGLPFALAARHERVNHIVRLSAGLLSVAFGLFYAWQVGISQGLLF
jgi:ABC-type nickel/cobalt efflux system permease component RcnA